MRRLAVLVGAAALVAWASREARAVRRDRQVAVVTRPKGPPRVVPDRTCRAIRREMWE